LPTAATFEIEYLQYLDADGKLVRDDLPALARDVRELVALYKEMLFVRVFDSKAVALQRTGKLGTYASCLGHEAAHIAIGSAMQEDDVFAPMYREYGAQFHRGVKPREVLLYWGGDERGSNFSGPAHDFAWCADCHAMPACGRFRARVQGAQRTARRRHRGGRRRFVEGRLLRRDQRRRRDAVAAGRGHRQQPMGDLGAAQRADGREDARAKASPRAWNACRSTATISSRCARRWTSRSSARATATAAWSSKPSPIACPTTPPPTTRAAIAPMTK
jgi:hypothetical protein